MKSTPRILISLLLILVVPGLIDASEATTIPQKMARCAAIGNDQERLACFDELARNVSSNNSQAQRHDFIQPPAGFLGSQLVTKAWKAEYKLTVRGFVELISHAVMDNKQRVTVQGWSRDKRDYVLNITMRAPVKLHFLPRKSANDNTPMSMLREVTMDGHTIDAGQFIVIIAAMN